MNKKLILPISSILLALPLSVLAVTFTTPIAWFTGIVDRFLTMVLWPLFLALVIIMSIWAAILFLTAQGNTGQIDKAKHAIIWIVIGIVVAIFAFSIVSIVTNIVGTVTPP